MSATRSRRSSRRARVLLLASALVLWGCSSGGEPSASPTPAPTTPSATASPTAQPTTTPSTPVTPTQPVRSTVGVYFVAAEHVQPVARVVEGAGVAAGAVRALLAGPTQAERAAGLTTAVPSGTALHSIDISQGLATVDLSDRFAAGGGTASMTMRVAQLVHTLTRFGSVSGVALRLDGQPVSTLGGEGVDVSSPMTRARFEEQAPAILVESPLWSERVTSPLRVTGTADVFEAVLHLELKAGGTVLVRQRVRATSGTGTRGTFSAWLTFRATGASGSLVGFVYSAKDGARQDVVTVPVRLAS